MFKKLLISTILLFSSTAFADRVDTVESWSDLDYCDVRVEQFVRGADARNGGHARELKRATDEIVELAKHNMVPKDGMYVLFWDQLSPREKEWMASNVFDGWDFANHALTKFNDQLDKTIVVMAGPNEWTIRVPQWIMDGGVKYFKECMKERATPKKIKSEHMKHDKDYLRRKYEESKT